MKMNTRSELILRVYAGLCQFNNNAHNEYIPTGYIMISKKLPG